MHSQHAHPEGVDAREPSQAHEGAGHRDLQGLGELEQFGGGVAVNNAAAGVEHRFFGLQDHFQGPFRLPGIPVDRGVITLDFDFLGKLRHHAGLLDIFRQIHQHRAGPPRTGDIKSLVNGAGQVFDVRHQVVVLGAGPGDAHDIHFLEGIVADERGGHLPGENHNRDGVHIGRGDAGHRVGGPGTGGHQSHAHLVGSPGITVGGVHRGLLVPHQVVFDFRSAGQLIIQVDNRSPWIPEDVLHPLPLKTFENNLGAVHFHETFSFARYLARICSMRSRPASFSFWRRLRSRVSSAVR